MWGWDIAGFSGDDSHRRALLALDSRWPAFCPIMQYHSELHSSADCRDRSPWNIAERHGDPAPSPIYRQPSRSCACACSTIIYEEAQEMSSHGLPLMRMPGARVARAHDFLASRPLCLPLRAGPAGVRPCTEKGAVAREVRLPPWRLGGPVVGRALQTARAASTCPRPLSASPFSCGLEQPELSSRLHGAVKEPKVYERGCPTLCSPWPSVLGPSLVGVALFSWGPILASLLLSFARWDLLTPPSFVGLRNFQRSGKRPRVLGGAQAHPQLPLRLRAHRHGDWACCRSGGPKQPHARQELFPRGLLPAGGDLLGGGGAGVALALKPALRPRQRTCWQRSASLAQLGSSTPTGPCPPSSSPASGRTWAL
jgi:hypothetical protein